jgi:ABC-type multidrug transport system fused ATPase/permease subunit
LYTQLSNIQQLRQSFLLSAPALANCQNELRAARANREYTGDHGEVLKDTGGADIKVNGLTISYGDHRALTSVSVDIPAGSIVGLTGPSGAGKSTMVDAIVGLVIGQDGDVLIDGHPIASLSPRHWRKHIGYVAQETLIIKGSVADNIGWGMPDATREQIKSAAQMASADEFIEMMPDGYDTIIGGRSVRMSGGQRQRIGLARALLGAKRLLILDEATSALDSTSEQKVLDAIAHLKGAVTVVMVAHRLSTLKLADLVLVFEEGRIVEQGAFDTLATADGAFSQLWRLQTSNTQVSNPE